MKNGERFDLIQYTYGDTVQVKLEIIRPNRLMLDNMSIYKLEEGSRAFDSLVILDRCNFNVHDFYDKKLSSLDALDYKLHEYDSVGEYVMDYIAEQLASYMEMMGVEVCGIKCFGYNLIFNGSIMMISLERLKYVDVTTGKVIASDTDGRLLEYNAYYEPCKCLVGNSYAKFILADAEEDANTKQIKVILSGLIRKMPEISNVIRALTMEKNIAKSFYTQMVNILNEFAGEQGKKVAGAPNDMLYKLVIIKLTEYMTDTGVTVRGLRYINGRLSLLDGEKLMVKNLESLYIEKNMVRATISKSFNAIYELDFKGSTLKYTGSSKYIKKERARTNIDTLKGGAGDFSIENKETIVSLKLLGVEDERILRILVNVSEDNSVSLAEFYIKYKTHLEYLIEYGTTKDIQDMYRAANSTVKDTVEVYSYCLSEIVDKRDDLGGCFVGMKKCIANYMINKGKVLYGVDVIGDDIYYKGTEELKDCELLGLSPVENTISVGVRDGDIRHYSLNSYGLLRIR